MESISCTVLFSSAPRLSHALHFCGFTLAFISAAALMMNVGCIGEQPRPCPAWRTRCIICCGGSDNARLFAWCHWSRNPCWGAPQGQQDLSRLAASSVDCVSTSGFKKFSPGGKGALTFLLGFAAALEILCYIQLLWRSWSLDRLKAPDRGSRPLHHTLLEVRNSTLWRCLARLCEDACSWTAPGQALSMLPSGPHDCHQEQQLKPSLHDFSVPW